MNRTDLFSYDTAWEGVVEWAGDGDGEDHINPESVLSGVPWVVDFLRVAKQHALKARLESN